MQIDRDKIAEVYEHQFKNRGTIAEVSPVQFAFLTQCLPSDGQSVILDAGCGDARYARRLMRAGFDNVHAMDLLRQIDVEGIHYSCASLEKLPYPDNRFDMVYCLSAVFYIEPPSAALAELCRVLKPGGRLVMTAHTRWSGYTALRIFKRDVLRLKKMQHLHGVKFYSAQYYLDALREAGMEIRRIEGWRLRADMKARRSGVAPVFTGLPPPDSQNLFSRAWQQLGVESAYHALICAQKSDSPAEG